MISRRRQLSTDDWPGCGRGASRQGACSSAPDLSRSRLKALILGNAVSLDGQAATDPALRLKAEQIVTLIEPEAEEAMPRRRRSLSTCCMRMRSHRHRQAGRHGGASRRGHHTGTLVNALLHHCGASLSGIGGVKRPGIVHRLDKETSGVRWSPRRMRHTKGYPRNSPIMAAPVRSGVNTAPLSGVCRSAAAR